MPNGTPYVTNFKQTYFASLEQCNLSSPVQTLTGGTNWLYEDPQSFEAGEATSASIKTDGTLWLWGYGDSGRLGTNNTINQSSPVQTVSTGTNWQQVSVGNFSSAIKTDGTLWLWGSGSSGQLGTNDSTNRSSPVQTVSTGNNWKQVSVCTVFSGAIKTDGTLWMWGNNLFGMLGTNSLVDHSSPVQTISTGTNWQRVAVSNYHSAAVKTDGTLWLWGCGGSGRLGNNRIINFSSPVQTVSLGNDWKQVSLGNRHSAAIKINGTLWLWGNNCIGVLGTDNATDRSSPVQTISTGTNWQRVNLGSDHSAAVKTDGTLWLWSYNDDGRLGTNTTINHSSPVQTISTGTNWKNISAGSQHSSSIKTDGTLWMWGVNCFGQIGTNDTIAQSSPVQTISTGTNWKSISGGLFITASVKKDGTLWAWGRNDLGQLGTNTTINRSSPVQTISTGTNWKQVSTGNNIISAITFTEF